MDYSVPPSYDPCLAALFLMGLGAVCGIILWEYIKQETWEATMQVTARVMRSYDYCHFEIALTSECDNLAQANELRKEAAILVDEAVRQYKIAKVQEDKRIRMERDMRGTLELIDSIQKTPQSEWTIQQSALMRAYDDKSFWADFDDEAYTYDDPERDHHFSMLSRFAQTRISAATADHTKELADLTK